jgi:hypothetical protein
VGEGAGEGTIEGERRTHPVVDIGARGDEEQPQKQPAEGPDVSLHLVAERRLRQQHTWQDPPRRGESQQQRQSASRVMTDGVDPPLQSSTSISFRGFRDG